MNRETFTIPGTDITLRNVHPRDKCAGEHCVIHNPSNHHMRTWRMHWRGDRGLMERLCPHGVGHPDPDQAGYWRLLNMEWMTVHGCDGCCWDAEGGALVPAGQDIDGPGQGGKTLLRIPEGVPVP